MKRGMIEQEPYSARYKLGYALLGLGVRLLSSIDLRREALPFLRDLAARFRDGRGGERDRQIPLDVTAIQEATISAPCVPCFASRRPAFVPAVFFFPALSRPACDGSSRAMRSYNGPLKMDCSFDTNSIRAVLPT